jgi:hypothetical protein
LSTIEEDASGSAEEAGVEAAAALCAADAAVKIASFGVAALAVASVLCEAAVAAAADDDAAAGGVVAPAAPGRGFKLRMARI